MGPGLCRSVNRNSVLATLLAVVLLGLPGSVPSGRVEVLLSRTIRRDEQKAYDLVLSKGIAATDTGQDKADWDAAAEKCATE